MLFDTRTLVDCLKNATMTACGLVLAGMPLALWTAWSQISFILILLGGVAAGLVFCMLVGDEKTIDPKFTRAF